MKLKLKNYRVIKKIGHGGMGLVYVAEDLALGRLVALKVLAPYLVQDPEILERFRFEARNQAQLVHTNITMVYSFLVEDEQAFLVLEFIDGETLESRINREGRIVAMEALPIFRKILGALGYAHSKGVIHRDIKPGNIAFTSEGDVKIMDFGIALNIEETGRLTKTGHVLGTPHYMAPEQILGKELTFRTDIYALGITLFEMLTGRLPFDSKSDFEVRVAQINHPPPSLRSFGYQDITPELEEVILKALAKEPEARFSSAKDFLQALEAAVGRDHLVTRVKGIQLDKSTQILEVDRAPEGEAPPAPSLAEVQDISIAPAPEPIEELPVPPPSEPEEVEPGAPPAEAQLAEGLGPPPPAPEREAPPATSLAEVQDISVAPAPEPMEELPVPPPSEMEEEEPGTPPAEAQLAEGLALPLPAPEREAPPAPTLAEVQDISVAPAPEPMEDLPVPPPSEPEGEEPSIPALSEPGGEAPSGPPPSELHREEEEPSALPSWGQQHAEPAAMPVPEQPFISPNMQTGWFSRQRLIFLTLSLLPLIALLILFRAYFLTGPSTPQTMVSPQAKATASEKVVPPATQPVSPVSKEPVSAELGKKAQDQPDKEKSATIAALPPSEKKVEIPEVKEPKPADLRKTVKESLAANGFSNLGVLVDEKKGVFISGNVKNMAQKNKAIEIVNSMGLSMPADYSNLKVMKGEVAETVKKRRPEAPSIPRPILEASPKPAPPEAPRKPLPPRLDRGSKEVAAETVKEKVQETTKKTQQIPEAPRKPLPPRMDRGNIQF